MVLSRESKGARLRKRPHLKKTGWWGGAGAGEDGRRRVEGWGLGGGVPGRGTILKDREYETALDV